MKRRKEFLLDESTIAYLEKYRDEKHCQTMAAALVEIVDDHRHRNDIDTTSVVIQQMAEKVTELLSDKLTRLRLGVNNADRNSDIIVMLLNTLLAYQELSSLITEETPQLQKARAIEKERIKNFREKKLDREAKKKERPAEALPTFIDDDLILNE